MHYFVILFIIGAVAGSFLNVCIHRLPRGESVVFPSSRCPGCGRKLSPADLIPILSYVFLGGRCRYCRMGISLRYPAVEILTGLLYAACGMFFPGALDLTANLVFCSLLVVIFFTDLEGQVIPDILIFAGVALGLAYNLLTRSLLSSILGLALGLAIFYSIARIGRLALKQEALGEGDIYLAAFMGAYLGWQNLLVAVFLAYLLAGLAAVFLLLAGRVKMGQAVAFGPAMAAGALVSLFFGGEIIHWYLRLFW